MMVIFITFLNFMLNQFMNDNQESCISKTLGFLLILWNCVEMITHHLGHLFNQMYVTY